MPPQPYEETEPIISLLQYRQIKILAQLEVALEIIEGNAPKFSVWKKKENKLFQDWVSARDHLAKLVGQLRDLSMEIAIDEWVEP
jgi:hypothetical protein